MPIQATTEGAHFAVGATSSCGDDDAAAIAVERLQRIAPRSLPNELRLLAGGDDIDGKLDPECVGEAQERREGRVVLPALEPRDGGLGHLQALCERGLAEAVLGAVGDHLHRDPRASAVRSHSRRYSGSASRCSASTSS
jgi:hypothetical protein